MSVIAKSLKKHMKQGQTLKKSVNTKGSSRNVNSIFIVMTIMFFILAGTYLLLQQKEVSAVGKVKYPSAQSLKKLFNTESAKINTPKKKEALQEIRFLLSTGQTAELYKLAKQKENKKFLGIYHYLIEQYDVAENYLRSAMASGSNDVETGSYLAAVYLEQKKYNSAINVLSALDKNKFQITYDMAVVYESMRNISKALEYYLLSVKAVKDPLLKYKIKVKIFLLQRELARMGGV